MSTNYHIYAKSNDLTTVIKSCYGSNYTISSIYRRFANSCFESWGWETLVFRDGRVIEEQGVLDSAEDVVQLHSYIIQEYEFNNKIGN